MKTTVVLAAAWAFAFTGCSDAGRAKAEAEAARAAQAKAEAELATIKAEAELAKVKAELDAAKLALAKSAPPKLVQPADQTLKPSGTDEKPQGTPGTLKLTILFRSTPRLWLYVDRRLVRDTYSGKGPSVDPPSESHSLTLPPGKHTIELMYQVFSEDRPFEFLSNQVKITSAGATELTVEIPPLGPGYRRDQAFADKLSMARTGGFQKELDALRLHYQEMEAYQKRKKDLYANDLLVLALVDINKKVQQPKEKTITVVLPEKYGGTREVDAGHIRIMVDWMADTYTGWCSSRAIPSTISFEVMELAMKDSPLIPAFREVRGNFEHLKEVNAANRERINQLKAVAQRLEEAR